MWVHCWDCWRFLESYSPFPVPHSVGVFPHHLCWLQCGQFLPRHLDALFERSVAHHLPLYLVDAVNHRGVIAAAERLPDLHELHAQHVAREVHRDLARNGERLGPGFGAESLRRHAPAPGHDLLDAVDAPRRLAAAAIPGPLVALADLVRERLAPHLDRDFAILERGNQQQLDDAPLDLADTGADMLRDEAQHVVRDGELEAVLLRLFPQARDAVLEIGMPDVGHHPPLEARAD